MSIALLPTDVQDAYEVHEWRHAAVVLKYDFPYQWQDIIEVLSGFRLSERYINKGGGSKSEVAASIDRAFYDKGWREKAFDTKIVVDNNAYPSPTHKVDCFLDGVGLEIEWNNKDPFFDRDLNNFRLLHELRVLSVGVIITRCDELQTIFDELGRGDSYGASTTHMSKLLPKVEGGGAGGCPLLVFGISAKLYRPGE